ncbi:MAG: hypothetical protein HY366_00605, partial [Candidatus Aenigmarchaeota archaeon]|nr:hypothetical protein [Candidatus Aenigmarchaeota archaeon]
MTDVTGTLKQNMCEKGTGGKPLFVYDTYTRVENGSYVDYLYGPVGVTNGKPNEMNGTSEQKKLLGIFRKVAASYMERPVKLEYE